MAIKKILVPTDFSDASKEALRYACTLAETLGASLDIIHVTENLYIPGGTLEYYPMVQDLFDQLESQSRQNLDALLTPEEKMKYRATMVQRSGGAAHEILNYLADQRNIDLVVMATHGRGGVARLMMGSVADKLVRAATCPVLTIRPNARPEEHANRAA